jgi:hypothetical protein
MIINMKEQLISFDTAKLAKEKEFDKLNGCACQIGWVTHFISGDSYVIDDLGNNHDIERPTQSLLQKWLRDVHKLHAYTDCNASGWFWMIDKTNGTSILWSDDSGPNPGGEWDNYEEALELALFEALNLIKNEK